MTIFFKTAPHVSYQVPQTSFFNSLDLQKIYDCSIRYFRPFRCLWTLTWGIKKICFHTDTKIKSLRTVHKVMEIVEGVSYLSAIPFEGVVSLQDFGLFDFGDYLPLFRGLGAGFFLFSQLASLCRHIYTYQHLSQLLKQDVSDEQKKIFIKQRSLAIVGMLSNIGYILMAACMLAGFHIAIALLFGCVGALFNVFEYFYDYLYAFAGDEDRGAKISSK